MRLAAFIFALWAATPALAQSCLPREAAVRTLAEQFGESRVGMGMTSGGTVVEVFASETGSWTILVTRSDGATCPVIAGEMWESLDDPRPAPGQDG